MGQIAGQNGELSPPGLERPQFVADLTLCVADWERALGGQMIPPDALAGLTRQGNALVQRSANLGFGGIGHHLSELVRIANQGGDVNSLRGRLDVVRELLGQARNALSPHEAAWASGRPMPSGPPPAMPGGGMAAPPPMITVHGRSKEVGSPVAGPGLAPPKMLFQSAIVPKGSEAPVAPPPNLGASVLAPQAPRAPSLGLPPLAPVPAMAAHPAPPPAPPGYGPPAHAAHQPPPFSPGGLGPQPPSPGFGGPVPNAPHMPHNPAAPPPMFGGAQPMAPKAAPLGLLDGSGGAPAAPGIKQPNLFVRSVLGLRVGRKSGEAGPPPLAPAGQPSAQSASALLGLKPGAAAPPVAPPPMLNSYAGMPQGLPGLKPDPRGGQGMRPESKGGSFPPLGRDPTPVPPGRSTNPRNRSGDHRISDHGRDMSRGRDTGRNRGGRGSRLPQQRESRWWIGVFAVGGIAVVIGLIVVVAVTASKRNDAVAPAPSASTSSTVAKNDTPLPGRKLSTEKESLQFMLRQIHGRGGKESNELRNLIDEQFAIIHENCVGPRCAELRKVLLSTGPKINIRRRGGTGDTMRSKWLAGLQPPEGLHIEDDPLVQRRFEFYTENPVGRETLQQMLFRCGAFRDMIQSTLVKNNMPAALIAVVFVESGCSPLAKSPAGAEGLWQFIPAAARAYHLQVREGVVDERHSPQKSTEAAIKFLSDMYAKFGDWDLVFAGYNMGPYGLAARINTIAGDDKVTFWDLVDAKMLPEETQGYAPSIEAIALILNNLQRLKFTAVQMRAPQVTADLEVPPNTRLTLIARAAAMSLNELRALNLDLKALSTPPTPNFAVQVPKDTIWQARDTLKELLKSKDDSDMCVPPNFDWGRQRFTPDMAKNCNRALADAQQELPAPDSAPAPRR